MLADAIIIGGGIHGCSAALQLARSGLKPLVLEQAYPGRHASGVNAGGVRRLGRHDAEIPLAMASMDLWHDMQALVDDDCGFQKSAQIKVAESAVDLQVLEKRVAHLKALGFKHEIMLDQAQLREWVPAISEHCTGAIMCEEDGHALPYQTVTAFRRAATKAGAVFKYGHYVNGIQQQGDTWQITANDQAYEAPLLINCAGAWANKIAEALGEAVPLSAQAPMLMITERLPHFCGPVIGATHRPLSFKQFDNGSVLIGGGHRGRADLTRQSTLLERRGLAANAGTACDLFPNLRNVRVMRCWAGIEAVMPDEIPVICPSIHYANAYHVFGFSAHGFQLGPITGQIVRDLVIHGSSELPIESFSIKRFLN